MACDQRLSGSASGERLRHDLSPASPSPSPLVAGGGGFYLLVEVESASDRHCASDVARSRRAGKPRRPTVWFRLRYSSFSIKDLRDAEWVVVASIQAEAYSVELKELRRKGVKSPDGGDELRRRNSPLLSLNPFIDRMGILRCGGRLKNAHDLSYDEKYPVLLPATSPSVVDLIRHYHGDLLHAGVDQVLAGLRRRF